MVIQYRLQNDLAAFICQQGLPTDVLTLKMIMVQLGNVFHEFYT